MTERVRFKNLRIYLSSLALVSHKSDCESLSLWVSNLQTRFENEKSSMDPFELKFVDNVEFASSVGKAMRSTYL